MSDSNRSTDKVVGDLLDAAQMAAEIVARGKAVWDADRLVRLAGEAVINRIGDAAGKLPDEVKSASITASTTRCCGRRSRKTCPDSPLP